MALVGRSRNPALTASAAKIRYDRSTPQKLKDEDWQERAWQVYEAEGSIYFMTRYRSAIARKLEYFCATVRSPGDDPNIDATYNDEGELVALGAGAKVLEAEGGPELIRRMVSELMVHWDVPGAAFVCRFDEPAFWRVLSTQELKRQDGKFVWSDLTEKRGTIDPDGVFRVWKAHPRYHWEADSPTKHILEDAEELILLRREWRARSQSRLPAGVWMLPDTVDLSPFGADNEGDLDDFAREMSDRMSLAIKDSGSAAQLTPWILTMAREDIEVARQSFLTFDRDWDTTMAQREALLKSIATGLDVPPEILTGMADLNHWSAWLVSEQAISQHVAPTVDDILDSLTVNWFRPLLAAASVDPDQYVLWRDLSPATAPPDRSDVSIRLFEVGAISAEALRRDTDHDEEDAPEEPEAGQPIMDADEVLKRINALGVLRRAGADWASANAAVGLPPIELIPGLLPITVRAEEVIQNEAPVVAAIDPVALDWIAEQVARRLQEGDPPLAEAAVTAAVRRRIVATELADIDTELLAWVVEESDAEIERLLAIVEKSLTAAVDPLDESMLARLAGRLEEQIIRAQARARGWLERLFGHPISSDGEVDARRHGIQTIIAGIINAVRGRLFTPGGAPDPIDTGRVPDIATPMEAIRRGLSQAGGGPPVYEDGRTVELIGNGQRVRDELTANGYETEAYVWRYGHPAHSFEPHRRLAGVEFDSWESPKLAVGVEGSWLGRSYYQPGDHRGCQCSFEQVVVALAEPSAFPGVRPDEPIPIGEALTWEQFGVKLPTDPARRKLLNEALQRLNGLDPASRARYLELLGTFNGGVKFNIATASTKAITELGKVSESLQVVGGTTFRKRSLTLQLSRVAPEYKNWQASRNDWVNSHRTAGSSLKDTLADGRPPASWPKNMAYLKWDEVNPAPTQWRLATPDELADVLVHELGHANDFQLQIDAGVVHVESVMPGSIFDKVRDMYHNGGDRIAAYDYAKSAPIEAIAELQKFYLRGVHGADIDLTASQWRLANPELAAWVKENYLP